MHITIDEQTLLSNDQVAPLEEQDRQTTGQSDPFIVRESLTTQQGYAIAEQDPPLDEQGSSTGEENQEPSRGVHEPVIIAANPRLGSVNAMSSPYRRSHKDLLIESEGIQDMLYYRYGFCNAPMPDAAEQDDMLSWLEVERLFGIVDHDKEHIPAEIQPAVQAFVSSLLHKQHPPIELCDLSPRSPHPHPMKIIKQYLDVIKVDGGYVISSVLASPMDTRCKIFLPRASTLFEIARRGCYKDKSHIVAELLAQGQPFRTVQEAPELANSIAIPPTIQKNFTAIGHELSVEDYLLYEERRDSLLKQPRGRAALMKGGIVWRLALEVLSEEDIFFAKIPEGFRFSLNIGDKYFVDDELTVSELDVIVGANYLAGSRTCADDSDATKKSQEEYPGRKREADEPGKMAESSEG
ncbi:hypothetical protein EIP86_004665 [Pleurotus ostreatoroseus]|nr:hypothetical protein EIP86_004665 [Pleurotus ostreatoroseus]